MSKKKPGPPPSPAPTLGQRLRALRQAKGLAQWEVVEDVVARLGIGKGRGFSASYLSKIEKDRLPDPPSASVLSALAEVLGAYRDIQDELLALARKIPEDI